MTETASKQEIEERIKKLYERISSQSSDWDAAAVVGRVNQYYLTGTMQDGLFVLKRDGSYAHFVRKSFARAQDECLVPLYSMNSYRDITDFLGGKAGKLYIDKDVATITVMERVQKALGTEAFLPLDRILQQVRTVKSEHELELMRHSGRLHAKLLDEVVPSLLEEGMDEATLTARIYPEMIALGYHGVSRFAMYQTEMIVGQIAFGENSIYPTSFDGPGGMKGMSAAVPIIGDRGRKLRRGDIVFVDIGFGYGGYHSDRTQIYMYREKPDDELVRLHRRCLAIEQKAAAMLKPGVSASDIYRDTVLKEDSEFLQNFMGLGKDAVRFLGHGVGACIDEYPVLAPGFDIPLEKNMVLALEPKKSLPGIGIVGVEDTYIVTEAGGECITGGEKDIIVV